MELRIILFIIHANKLKKKIFYNLFCYFILIYFNCMYFSPYSKLFPVSIHIHAEFLHRGQWSLGRSLALTITQFVAPSNSRQNTNYESRAMKNSHPRRGMGITPNPPQELTRTVVFHMAIVRLLNSNLCFGMTFFCSLSTLSFSWVSFLFRPFLLVSVYLQNCKKTFNISAIHFLK